jgi:hypothetical protein
LFAAAAVWAFGFVRFRGRKTEPTMPSSTSSRCRTPHGNG